MEYMDLLAENAQNQDIVGTYETPSKTQPYLGYHRLNNFFVCDVEWVAVLVK